MADSSQGGPDHGRAAGHGRIMVAHRTAAPQTPTQPFALRDARRKTAARPIQVTVQIDVDTTSTKTLVF